MPTRLDAPPGLGTLRSAWTGADDDPPIACPRGLLGCGLCLLSAALTLGVAGWALGLFG